MKYYIQDTRTFVGNGVLFWRQDKNGYTTDIDEAGLFTKEEAKQICQRRKTDIAWPEDYLQDKITRIVDAQYLDIKKAKYKKPGGKT